MEWCAALAPWAVFNVHRDAKTAFLQPTSFMFRKLTRHALDNPSRPAAPSRGTPARILGPVPASGSARYAMPGERPPSRLSPGESDSVIDQFDAYRTAYNANRVKRA